MIEISKSPTADTRTCDFANVPKATLLSSSAQHIADVGAALAFFGAKLTAQAVAHDTDKLTDIDGFHADFLTGFKETGWWALENPPGRHQKLIDELGPPAWQFQPWEYGDPWGKQTYIWGTAVKPPVVAPVEPEPTRRTPNGKTQGRIAFMSSSWKAEREKTPAGFARAFAETNL